MLCTSCSRNYKFEDKIYDCLVSNFAVKGITLSESIDSLEFYLTNDSLMDSRIDNPYYTFFEKISQPDYKLKISNATEDLLFDLLAYGLPIECNEQSDFDTSGWAKSKMARFMEYSSLASDAQNFEYFYGLRKIFQPEDLEHPLYKAILLNTFFRRYVEPRPASCGGPMLLQMCINCNEEFRKDSIMFQDTLYFHLNSYYFVEVNGKKMELELIPKFVSDQLRLNNSKSLYEEQIENIGVEKVERLFINIEYSEETSYNSRCDLYEKIYDGFEIVKDELSKEKFGLTFNELENKYQKSIDKVFPVYLNRP